MDKHAKSYKDEAEYLLRLATFRVNLLRYDAMNLEHKTNIFGVTKFSDLSVSEFRSKFLGFRASPDHMKTLREGAEETIMAHIDADLKRHEAIADLPSTWDWRTQGIVTQVNDQGQVRNKTQAGNRIEKTPSSSPASVALFVHQHSAALAGRSPQPKLLRVHSCRRILLTSLRFLRGGV
jgi:hypothetical protein